MTDIAPESHVLDLKSFSVEAKVDETGECEVVFSRHAKPVFRAPIYDLQVALTFVEKHAEVQVVPR